MVLYRKNTLERLGLIYEVDELDKTRSYHYNNIGSTTALTDDMSAVTGRVEYSPYGKITYVNGTINTPFLYNGKYGVQTDEGNGLLYMRARYYSTILRRFLNVDPIGFNGGMNFYAYADGNPISFLDPFGFGAMDTGISSDMSVWDMGWEVGKEYYKGLAQGALNTVQGVQDIAVGTADVAYQYNTVSLVAKAAGADIGSIESHDWARGKIGNTSDSVHWWSKTLGGEGAATLLTLGAAKAASFARAGRELSYGKNLRVAPFGNRTGHPIGKFSHYHRRGLNKLTGKTRPGQGIGRHRPFERKATDTSFWDRF